jgi:hypothetical protein
MLSDEHVNNICKMGQKAECCRYLTIGANGFSCAKLTELKPTIDDRVASKQFTAKGDNCPGVSAE